jgi:ATP-dependent DNA helicase RecG
MTALFTLEDIKALKETWQIECKLAQGRDGEGALPEDIWETYSAFANTQGGDIFLGLRELGPGDYKLAGIPTTSPRN